MTDATLRIHWPTTLSAMMARGAIDAVGTIMAHATTRVAQDGDTLSPWCATVDPDVAGYAAVRRQTVWAATEDEALASLRLSVQYALDDDD